MSDQAGLAIIVICIILSAYFSATETAFNSVNTLKIKSKAEKGDRKASRVMKLLDQYDRLLSAILIGNNLVNIAATSLATVIFVKHFGDDLGSGLSTLVITIVLLIFGEITPKTIAKASADTFSMFAAPSIQFIMTILTPFTWLFGLWQKLIGRIFKSRDDDTVTDDEILSIVKEAERGGEIDGQESDLISNSIDFNETEAEDILTPRVDIEAVEKSATKEEVEQIFIETGFSRIPVYKDDIDNIIGIIYQKDFYNKIYHNDQPVSDIIRPVVYTTPHRPIGELLREFQQKKIHVAIIIDEYGGTVGLVTMEDILEELVGEIWDEHEEVVEEIRKVSDREYRASGSASIYKVFEEIGLPEDEDMEALTLSGWITDMTGHIPKVGDVVTYNHIKVIVREVKERRVEQAIIRIMPRKNTDAKKRREEEAD